MALSFDIFHSLRWKWCKWWADNKIWRLASWSSHRFIIVVR